MLSWMSSPQPLYMYTVYWILQPKAGLLQHTAESRGFSWEGVLHPYCWSAVGHYTHTRRVYICLEITTNVEKYRRSIEDATNAFLSRARSSWSIHFFFIEETIRPIAKLTNAAWQRPRRRTASVHSIYFSPVRVVQFAQPAPANPSE